MDLVPLVLAFISGLAAGLVALLRLYRPALLDEARGQAATGKGVEAAKAVPVDNKITNNTAEESRLAYDLEQANKEVQGLKLQQESKTAQLEELEANFEELKQLVALQHDSEAERLQEHSALLFSAWSDALKEELEQKLNSMAQHIKLELHGADPEEQRPEESAAQLSERVTREQAMKSDIAFLQAAVRELQELAMEPNTANAVADADETAALGNSIKQSAATQESMSSKLRQKSKDFLSSVGSGKWKPDRKNSTLLKGASK